MELHQRPEAAAQLAVLQWSLTGGFNEASTVARSYDGVLGAPVESPLWRGGGGHTFPFLLKTSARLPLPVSKQIHALVLKHGLHRDTTLPNANALVHVYSVARLMGVAWKVFDELPVRSMVVYTMMASGYAQNRRYKDAMGAFDDMLNEGFEPGAVVMASVLSTCARSESGGLRRGMAVPLEVILGMALVDVYAKNWTIKEAVTVFKGMPERHTATWNALIPALTHHGHGKDALAMFQQMRREGVLPNATTLVKDPWVECHWWLRQ
uniref:Pentatricopeptide repeat-containing protein n=1 Tax=Aegilops tauschii TaxID=37682 RepID=M8BVF9_AEGTA